MPVLAAPSARMENWLVDNPDREIIEAFILHLRNHGIPGLAVDEWPDTKNRTTSDIDAIAGNLAIEHTSVDTVFEQRKRAQYFATIADCLKDSDPGLDYQLTVAIPYDAFKKKIDLAPLKRGLHDWIRTKASSLSEGTHSISGLENIPFDFQVIRMNAPPFGLFFARIAPNNDTLAPEIRRLFVAKGAKLARYKKDGRETILLVESGDVALMNYAIFCRAVRDSYPDGLPHELDAIWFVHNIQGKLYFYECRSGDSNKKGS